MRRMAIVGILAVVVAAVAAPPGPGTHAKVAVAGPTRLDWTFAVSNRSTAAPPAKWTEGYESTKATYELVVPAKKGKGKLPLILFVSPSKEPAGRVAFEKFAKAQGFLFASPRDAGNDCPGPRRVRIVLDVLDDVRKNFDVDTDRTYIGGFSGGGRIACAIGFALPELFGGVIPVCAGGALREESWLRERVKTRLSVALLTGETDFNRGEVERLRATYFDTIGVRHKVWTQKGLGHGIPNEKTVADAVKWLEDGLPARKALAEAHPASRAGADTSRAAVAKALFAEGEKRRADPKGAYAGIMLLKGVMDRFEDMPEAGRAKKVLLALDDAKDKPWEKDDVAEQRRFLLAQARGLDAYGSGDLPPQYAKQRGEMVQGALDAWKQLAADDPAGEVGKEAKQRIEALRKRIDRD